MAWIDFQELKVYLKILSLVSIFGNSAVKLYSLQYLFSFRISGAKRWCNNMLGQRHAQ